MTVIYLNDKDEERVLRNVVSIEYIGGQFALTELRSNSRTIISADKLMNVIQ